MDDVLETDVHERADARDRELSGQGFDSEDPSGFNSYQPSCFQQPDSSEGEVDLCHSDLHRFNLLQLMVFLTFISSDSSLTF